MKRLLLLIPVLCCFLTAQSQLVRRGTVLLSVEGGIGAFSATENYSDNDDAEPTILLLPHSQIRLDAGIKKGLTLGLTIRSNGEASNTQTTTTDSTTTVKTDSYTSGTILFNTSYYLVNKNRFGWFIGTGLGGTTLNATVNETLTNTNQNTEVTRKDVTDANAITVSVQSGIHVLLTKRLGLNASAAYTSIPFQVTSHLYGGVSQDVIGQNAIPLDEASINLRGVEVGVGLTWKFGKLTPDATVGATPRELPR